MNATINVFIYIVNWRISLQYLHNEKKLLHGDMKSCNIVIKGDFETIKICDVGVSLHLDENMKGKPRLQLKDFFSLFGSLEIIKTESDLLFFFFA